MSAETSTGGGGASGGGGGGGGGASWALRSRSGSSGFRFIVRGGGGVVKDDIGHYEGLVSS